MSSPISRFSMIDLSGEWKVALQRPGMPDGLPACADPIRLPGSLQEQGYGDEISVETQWTGRIIDDAWYKDERYAAYRTPGNIKIPFWLQPNRHFLGAAWFQRQVEIPAEWQGRRIVLTLERPHIQTTVWLDDLEIGSQNGLSAPHIFDLGCNCAPGVHRLTIRVDNRLHVDVGCDAHSVSDHTQSNWNGITGRIELSSTYPVWIEDVQVYPDAARRQALLRIRIGNATGKAGDGTLSVGELTTEAHWDAGGGECEMLYTLPQDAVLWDEFSPVLQRLCVRLLAPGIAEERAVDFGLRDVAVEGTQMAVNRRKIFLRGTLECAVFPKTGYPPTDAAEWKRILGIIKSYGFNHVRFHSWCPPEAAFVAGDELGLYFQVECSSWANSSTALGLGHPVDAWLYEEARSIIKHYGNHPSFLLLAYGNEPGGKHHEYLTEWVRHWKKEDPRRLYTSGAGWPALEVNDYDNIFEPRTHWWGEGVGSRINALPPATTADYGMYVEETPRPLVSHEIGQWCAYPDLSEIPKYTGVLKAKNFEIFRETLEANHMGDQARDFLMASGRLQVLCYKEEIESALRTPGFGGFQILQANDFPGQGTALVGWLNAFWESKGYATPEEFRRFNNSTVLLARLERRTFSTRERLRADLEIAHFGPQPLQIAEPVWMLVDESGKECARGVLPPRTIPIGNGISLGQIDLPLRGLAAPAKYRLVLSLAGTDLSNDWDVWVYPSRGKIGSPAGIETLHNMEAVLERAERGGNILFLPGAEAIAGDVALGFSSIFWNTAWTEGQAPHTLGILCDPSHPALAGFPTEFCSNWQWWELIHGAGAFVMDGLPPALRPIVQVVDDWFTNRRLGLLFEARLGKAQLLCCGMQLTGLMTLRHAARQFRLSLYEYMAGSAFAPRQEIRPDQLRNLLRK